MTFLRSSTAPSLVLISIWCWLNVVAMLPSLGDPVIVLFGYAARGPGASLLKFLIFANGVAISLAVTVRLRPGRVVLIGWLVVLFANSLFTDFVPSCPPRVIMAAYRQVLFGGLVPYLYVTVIPTSNLIPMHVANAAATTLIIWFLIKRRSLFVPRAPVLSRRRKDAATVG
jgi:hypothetical protein